MTYNYDIYLYRYNMLSKQFSKLKKLLKIYIQVRINISYVSYL